MTTPTVPDPNAALAAAGANANDVDDKTKGNGPNTPPAPSNTPPVDDAAQKAAAEKEAADKAAADAQAAEDAKAKEAENKPLDTAVWGSTGDEVGDSVLELIQNSGLSVEETKALMYDAVKAGDPAKIDRDALVEKVGKAKATLILAGVENFVNNSKAKAQTILTEVHGTVGGEANWKQVTEWAKANVAEAELAQYRTMIDAGGAQARFAAAELAAKYNGDSKNTTLTTAKTTEILGDGKPPSDIKPLNKADYYKQINAAYARGATQAEIDQINAARAAGRAKGL